MGCNLFLTDLPADELDSMQFLRAKLGGEVTFANEPTGASLNKKLMWRLLVLEKRLEDQRKVQNASECIYVLARSRNPDFLRLGPSILRQQFPWLIFVHTSAVGMVADVTNKGVNDAGAFFCLSGPGLGGR